MGTHSIAPRRGRATRLLAFLLLAVAGCRAEGCDTSGFRQLAGTTPRTVRFPGHDMGLVGSMRPLRGLGRSGRLTAVVGMDADKRVRVVPIGEGSRCTATTLSSDLPPNQLVPAVVEDLIAVLEDVDEQGRGVVHVYDTRCDEVVSPMGDARPVPGSERLLPSALLLLSHGTDLVALDVESRSSEVIDEEVSWVFITATHVVAHAGAEVVVRDASLKEIQRVGSSVSEVAVTPNEEQVVFVDEGSLYRMAVEGGDPTHIDDEVCAVGFADPSFESEKAEVRYLSYLSPCDTLQLTVYDIQTRRRIPVGPAASSVAAVRSVDADGERLTAVFHLVGAESPSSSSGSLAVALDGRDAVEIGTGSVGSVGRVISNGINLWIGGGTPESRLVRWTPDGALTDLSSELVVDFAVRSYPERALVEGADGELDVLAVEGHDEPQLIAERAANLGRSSESSTLLGHDVEQDVGTLRYADRETGSVTDVAETVLLSTASFSFAAGAILYLDRYDLESATGRLCVRITDTADEFCETSVSSFHRTVRPERGVAYVKSRDGQQRLFWAPME